MKNVTMDEEQFRDFLNSKQRDPRLNEILYPFFTTEDASRLIKQHEPDETLIKEGKFVVLLWESGVDFIVPATLSSCL